MEKEDKIIDKVGGRRPFSVPEGYFDNLTDGIMAALPQEDSVKQIPVAVTPWMRIKPYIYMAATFAGMFFCLRFAAGLGRNESVQTAQAEETTIYTDEYIDSFLETAMIDDCTLYYSLVNAGN